MEIRPTEEVATALADGRAVVALESTIIAHGLPAPDNLAAARTIEAAVRASGAVPATIAVLDGRAHLGLDDASLERLGTTEVAKLAVRDLPVALAQRRDGATTVSATATIAAKIGIELFATGGLGGVHREARTTWDESADLVALARTPVTVVCAGVKSILDVPATLERLETLGIPVVGYRTDRFPGFYLSATEHPLDWTAADADEVARIIAATRALLRGAVVVANPVAPDRQLDPDLHERVLTAALAAAEEQRIRGKDVTPFLLDWFHSHTGGESLRVNTELAISNAALAGEIAVARIP